MRIILIVPMMLALAMGTANAHDMHGGIMPMITAPLDGATVSAPVTVSVEVMGMQDMGAQHHAHLHLLIDSPLPAAGTMIPMDDKHIHLMHGEQKASIRLAPGKHTIQAIIGGDNHTVPENAEHSELITVFVK